MTMTHTPGPWFAREEIWTGAGLTSAGGCFAIMDSEDPEKANVLCTRFAWDEKADEMRANARLIAAAPELLEALEMILPMLADWHEEFPDHVGDKEDPAIKAARAAIAKAKGEQQ